MPQPQVDISQKSVESLKAMAYEQMQIIQNARQNLQLLQNRIEQGGPPQLEVESGDDAALSA